jgi:hypothetical protein
MKEMQDDLDSILDNIASESSEIEELLRKGPLHVDTLLSTVKRKEVSTHTQLLSRFKSMRSAGDKKIAEALAASSATAGMG